MINFNSYSVTWSGTIVCTIQRSSSVYSSINLLINSFITKFSFSCLGGNSSVFVGLPFLVSVYCTANNLSESFEPLVSTMDGGLIVLSVVGTVASLTSIAMTFKDRKRYDEEKEQLSDLKYLVNKISVENYALVVDLFGDDYAARIGVSDGYNKEQQEQSRWHPEENSGEIKD